MIRRENDTLCQVATNNWLFRLQLKRRFATIFVMSSSPWIHGSFCSAPSRKNRRQSLFLSVRQWSNQSLSFVDVVILKDSLDYLLLNRLTLTIQEERMTSTESS